MCRSMCSPHSTLITAFLLAWVVAGGLPQAQAQDNAAVAEFRKLAGGLTSVCLDNLFRTRLRIQAAPVETEVALRSLIHRASELPAELLKSESAKERALAAIVFALADDPARVGAVARLMDDDATTFKEQIPPYVPGDEVRGRFEDRTVGEYARVALGMRLWGPHSEWAKWSSQLAGPKEFAAYWDRIERPDELPSEWMFRLRKAMWAGEDVSKFKEQVAKVRQPARAYIMASVLNETSRWHDAPFSEREVVEAFRTGVDAAALRELVDGTRKIPGMSFRLGPNADHVPGFVLDHAGKLFTPADAEWLAALAAKAKADDPLRAYYAIAAAKLDPAKADQVLRAALDKLTEDYDRIGVLLELWERCANRDRKFLAELVDFYYGKGRKKPDDLHVFQAAFVTRFVREFGPEVRPLLAAVITDGRFAQVGWTAMRALARPAPAEIVCGRNPGEAKLVLSVRHPLQPEQFDTVTAKQKGEHPRETERVNQTVAAYREFLIQHAAKPAPEKKN